MYSQKKIQETLDAFTVSEGWTPTPHSLQEVDEFKEYISSITTIVSNSKNSYIELKEGVTISPNRQREVMRWIENEQAMCAIDSGYFESRYAYLTNEYGVIAKFQNRKSQDVLDSIIADLEEKDSAIELLIRSHRQTGISTKIALKMIHRALFVPNTSVVLASAMHERSEFIKQMSDTIYDQLPWWLIPYKKNKGFLNNNSRAVFTSGMNPVGIAQGLTPQCVYVSNVDDIPNPMKIIEEGLLRAVHSSRNTFLVLHGHKTPKSSWFGSTWRYAKEYYSKGMFRLCPVFIPWFLCSDIYPHPDWLRKFPILKKWKPMEETIEQAARCEAYVKNTPILSKIMGDDWKMPMEQRWFWEFNYKEAKVRQSLDSFAANFSLDEDEIVPVLAPETESEEVDLDALFPQPIVMQEKVAAARNKNNKQREAA